MPHDHIPGFSLGSTHHGDTTIEMCRCQECGRAIVCEEDSHGSWLEPADYILCRDAGVGASLI